MSGFETGGKAMVCRGCGEQEKVRYEPTLDQLWPDAVAHPYAKLRDVLERAFTQASGGKGKERHAEDGEAFEDQIICEVRRRVGYGYTRGQAVKKIYEAARLPRDRAVAELLGAINYIAADIIVLEEEA